MFKACIGVFVALVGIAMVCSPIATTEPATHIDNIKAIAGVFVMLGGGKIMFEYLEGN